MRPGLILVSCCLGCAQQSTAVQQPVAGTTVYREEIAFKEPMSLTPRQRVKIVEAVLFYRLNAFPRDTLILDGCSVALAVGADYRGMLRKDFAALISAPAKCAPKPDHTGHARRLVVDDIVVGAEHSASVRLSYMGGGHYTHFEWYGVSGGPGDETWHVREMLVDGAMIID